MVQIKIIEKEGKEPLTVIAPTLKKAFEILVLKGILDPASLIKSLQAHR